MADPVMRARELAAQPLDETVARELYGLVPVLCDIIDELRADLCWYADEAHYATRRDGGPSKILSDAGTRARNTLEFVTPETQ